MTQEYELTQEDLDSVLEASEPTRYMVIGGVEPRSPQENANAAWQRLADKYGFVWDTVGPVSGKGQCFITAEARIDTIDMGGGKIAEALGMDNNPKQEDEL